MAGSSTAGFRRQAELTLLVELSSGSRGAEKCFALAKTFFSFLFFLDKKGKTL
jgi:hypothetical protein